MEVRMETMSVLSLTFSDLEPQNILVELENPSDIISKYLESVPPGSTDDRRPKWCYSAASGGDPHAARLPNDIPTRQDY
ncbi:hypothetical protein E4U57_000680 [Claviceps arundinis]|uniref:Protein kinase domain-containing protein n=1 Tax=Claviceps arundinis TaxID=1623583 RepID=A0ABQ7PLZ2_9HYPO|nr:hypothetical protein E4U57_000680 [Claviceps arundinis]